MAKVIEDETIPLERISTEIQSRAAINEIVVREYAEALKNKAKFPGIDVFFDEESAENIYWLADGLHRLRAVQQIGGDTITANVFYGSKRDAILWAVGRNESHGLRRSNADRRQSVMLMLSDPEWRRWSSHKIAEKCSVSHTFVNNIRREMKSREGERASNAKRKVERGGQEYDMKVRRIGTGRKKSVAEPPVIKAEQPASEVPSIVRSSEEPAVNPAEPVVASSGNGFQIEEGMSTTAVPEEQPPETAPATSTVTEPNVLKVVENVSAASEQTPAVTPNSPLESSSEAAAEPGQHAPTPVPVLEISLEEAWGWATHEQREAFVWHHRKQLRAMLTTRERQNVLSS